MEDFNEEPVMESRSGEGFESSQEFTSLESQSCEGFESSQEFTSLMPMEPMDFTENENYYSSYSPVPTTSHVTEEEVIPTEYASTTFEIMEPLSNVPGTSSTTEEEIPDEMIQPLSSVPGTSSTTPEEISEEMLEGEDEELVKTNSKENSKQKHTQEEIISKLLEDKISFSEVAELLGDDGEDSDLETQESSNKSTTEEPSGENHAAEFEKELSEQQRYHLKRKSGRRRRRRLPAALQGLMGEANLRYARREHDEAIKMCMEIIRQYPHSPEPYQTLGVIYEEKKMVNKSLQFLLIAAFLSSNAQEWEKLAELSFHQLHDNRQAVFCWGRAIRANPQNLYYHWERCKLLEKMGERTKALKGYIHMVKFLRPDQGENGLKLAKEIAQMHYENGDIHLAQDALETAFKKYPTFVTAEYVNPMLEVLMQREQYLRCVEVLNQYMGLCLQSKNISDEKFQQLSVEYQVLGATHCIEPDNLAMDLRVKLAIAFIHLNKLALAGPIVKDLMEMPVDTYGDFHFEVSEAYNKTQNAIEAIPLLESLIVSDHFSKAAVWLLYGKCLVACDRTQDAVEAYREVIELAPQLGESRLTLSSLLQSLGETEEALEVLNEETSSESLDALFLFQKSEILLEHQQTDLFIKTALLFFSRDFLTIKSREEAETILSIKKLSSKFEAIRELRKGKEEPEDKRPVFVGPEIPVEKQWELFKKLCNVLHEEKRYAELQRVTFSSLTSRELMRDKDRAKEMEFLCLLSCIYNESFYFAFNIMREIIIRFPNNNRAWNLLCYIISKADDFRHNRFLLRLVDKHPNNSALSLLNGHNSLVSGTYKFCVAEYLSICKNKFEDPLIHLMLGITYTHMACQKFSGNKNDLVVQGVAFLQQYLEKRSECQEAYYNLGRAMHQLSLFTHAVHYYKKALEAPPFPTVEGGPDLNLKAEIAFNLGLIYKRNDPNLAKYYLKKYARFD